MERGRFPAYLVDMSHGPATAVAPGDPRRRQAWRVACLTYRQCRRENHLETICFHNARHQLWLLMPELDYWAAAEETTRAIYYASWKHPAWLWSGTSGLPPRPEKPFVPPHIIDGPMALAAIARAERMKA